MLVGNTQYAHSNVPVLDVQFILISKHLLKTSFHSLLALPMDDARMFELGLRYFSGCTVKQRNVSRAMSLWEAPIEPEDDVDTTHASTSPWGSPEFSLPARAASCLAHANFELQEYALKGKAIAPDPDPNGNRDRILPTGVPDRALSDQFLYLSGLFVEAAARLGLVSPLVLRIPKYLVQTMKGSAVDVRESRKYGGFTHLWCAYDARNTEIAEEERRHAAKVSKAPNAYICAVPGCGIAGSQKKALVRCAGKCPAHRKPHYCSKECQKKDWKGHKHYCKPDDELPGKIEANSERSDSTASLEEPPEMPHGYEGPERSITMNLPGMDEPLILESRYLTPELMRWMRDMTVVRK
ncbi:hypothetical protein C8Q80DRAFT_1189519 [Daedaleopsis nitida]|nr:hypothetical protein C8Q80DRAFT_1189519 [Daedaleopsis nitida]